MSRDVGSVPAQAQHFLSARAASFICARPRVCAPDAAGLAIPAAFCRFLPTHALVLAAPAPRAQPDEPVKCPREGRLVTEAGLAGDVDERSVGRCKQLLGALDPAIRQP